MREEQENEVVRKPYQKPEARKFPLRPEEAVLGNCKTTGTSGPSGGGCRTLGTCRSQGS